MTVDKPSPPRNLRVVETSKEFMVVTWEVPESDGGSAITKYKVEKRDATRTAYVQAEEVDGKTLKAKVTKLTEGNKYFFQVAAENEIGLSEWTETTEPAEAKMPFGMKIFKIFNVHNFIHPSIHPFIHLSIHPSVHPSIHLSIHGPCIYLILLTKCQYNANNNTIDNAKWSTERKT